MSTQLDANQCLQGAYDEPNQLFRVNNVGASLVPDSYDQIDLTYVAAGNGAGEIQTVTYSLSGSQIALLTLTYDASNRLINVVRS